ncbi:hypothetical protein, partial [Pseudomonas viridiflava]|uniref:hypothetical protein n=1 Tax=Pseudomonas viridiflava TaxID=33069 RepID=UPI0019CFE9F6
MGRDDHRNQSSRAWVRMPSERRLDLLDPTPFDWDDSDLALGLARYQPDLPFAGVLANRVGT